MLTHGIFGTVSRQGGPERKATPCLYSRGACWNVQTIVETPGLLERCTFAGNHRGWTPCHSDLAAHPDAGKVIEGTGGARKVRFAGKGKGKSGGYRGIAFFSGAQIPVFLLNIFAKNEKS